MFHFVRKINLNCDSVILCLKKLFELKPKKKKKMILMKIFATQD